MSDRKLHLVIRSGQEQKLNIGPSTAPRQSLKVGGAVPIWEKDYEHLKNKPQINGVTLEGDKTTRQLKIEVTDPLTNLEIEAMLAEVFN